MYNNPEQAKLASLIISIVILIIIVVLIVVVCCNWNTISANANTPIIQNPQKAALGVYAYNKNNFVDYASGENPPWPCNSGFTYGSHPPRYYNCNTHNIQTAPGGYCPGNYRNVNGLCIPSWAAPTVNCATNSTTRGQVIGMALNGNGAQLCASSYFLFNAPISSITQLGIQCSDYTDTNANGIKFYRKRKGIFGTIVNSTNAIKYAS
uniref:Uncharacterized protein n=1 Tax=viral metagenome TaxID=1070528 RepID=A0A6C0I0M0_9ZZZZ